MAFSQNLQADFSPQFPKFKGFAIVVIAGTVMVCVIASTTTVTLSVSLSPSSSVKVSLNTYVPVLRGATAAVAVPALAINASTCAFVYAALKRK